MLRGTDAVEGVEEGHCGHLGDQPPKEATHLVRSGHLLDPTLMDRTALGGEGTRKVETIRADRG